MMILPAWCIAWTRKLCPITKVRSMLVQVARPCTDTRMPEKAMHARCAHNWLQTPVLDL